MLNNNLNSTKTFIKDKARLKRLMDIETDGDKITRRSEQIGDQPLSGRTVPDFLADDIRELIEPPYRIIYRVKPERIDVLAVIHGARLMPDEL